MQSIGTRLKRAPAEFERVRDIEFYEGPLVTEFQTSTGQPYLFIWRDRDDLYNRWFAVRVTKRDIALYENRELPLASLIERAMHGFLVDIDGRGVWKRWFIAAFEQLPPEYLPEGNSFFDPELRPPHERKGGQSILIDGDWALADIVEYPRRYRDVYSMQYLLSPGADERVGDRPFRFTFKGGWVYNTFFTALAQHIPEKDQAEIVTFQYSSPGIIEMSSDDQVAAMVTASVHRLGPQLADLKEHYSVVFSWASVKNGRALKKAVASDDEARGALAALCEGLGSLDLKRIQRLTGDLLNTAQIVLAYFRRLETLVKYEASGMAKLVSLEDEEELDFGGVPMSARR